MGLGEDGGEAKAQALGELSRWLGARWADLDSAIAHAQRALAVGEDAELERLLVGWLASAGRLREASEVSRALAGSVPAAEAARFWGEAALLAARAGDGVGAAEDLRRAVAIDAGPLPAHRLGALGAWAPEAVTNVEAADNFLLAANRRATRGDKVAVFEEHLRAFEACPSHYNAATSLYQLLASKGRWAAALGVWRAFAEAAGAEATRGPLRRAVRQALGQGGDAGALGDALALCLELGLDNLSGGGERSFISELSSRLDLPSEAVERAATAALDGRAAGFVRISAEAPAHGKAALLAAAARLLAREGRRAQARELARRALEADPTLGSAFETFLDVFDEGEGRQIVTFLEKAAGVLLPRARLYERLSSCWQRMGEPHWALAWSKRWVSLRPADPEALSAWLQHSVQVEDGRRLAEALEHVLSTPVPLSLVRVGLGVGLRRAGLDASSGGALVWRALRSGALAEGTELGPTLRDVARERGDAELEAAILEAWTARGGESPAPPAIEVAEAHRRREEHVGEGLALQLALAQGTPWAELSGRVTVPEAEEEADDPDKTLLGLELLAAAASSGQAPADDMSVRALRELGALRWDRADDQAGAITAWVEAARLDPVAGWATLAADVIAFAGEGAGQAILSELTNRGISPRDAARALAAASLATLRAGGRTDAAELAERALALDSARIDALAVLEAALGRSEAEAEQLERAYGRLAASAKGAFGRRASHYRAARQFELRGLIARARDHALAAFEAAPSVGAASALACRLVEQSGGYGEGVATFTRVASSSSDPTDRGRWLRQAAVWASQAGSSAAERAGLWERVMAEDPAPDAFDGWGEALSDLALGGGEGAARERFEGAGVRALEQTEGPSRARLAIALARVALEKLRQPALAAPMAVRALRADAFIDEYEALVAHAEALAGAERSGGEGVVRVCLGLLEGSFRRAGPAALRLGAEVARAAGNGEGYAKLRGAIEPDDAPAEGAGEPGVAEDDFGSLTDGAGAANGQAGLASDKGAAGERAAAPVAKVGAVVERAEAPVEPVAKAGAVVERAEASAERAEAPAGRADVAAAASEAPVERQIFEAASLAPGVDGGDWEGLQGFEIDIDLEAPRSERPTPQRLVAARPMLDIETTVELDEAALGALELQVAEQHEHEVLADVLARRIASGGPSEDVRVLRLRRAALLEQRLGRLDEAKAELEALLGEHPNALSALRFLADLYERTGEPARAGALWWRALQVSHDPYDRRELALRAADALARGGDLANARAMLTEASSLGPDERVLTLRVEIERRAGGRGLADALDELAVASAETPRVRARLLADAARASLDAGERGAALERAQRAARVGPDLPDVQLLARLLEYRARGAGTPHEAAQTVEALKPLASALAPEQVPLHAFLLAEALDVVGGVGAGLRELSARHAEVGSAPLIALGMAERLARSANYAAALGFFDVALAGDMMGLRHRGALALSAAEAALRVDDLGRAERYLREASLDPAFAPIARQRLDNLHASRRSRDAASVPQERHVLEELAGRAVGPERARALAKLARLSGLELHERAEADRLLTEAIASASLDTALRSELETERDLLRGVPRPSSGRFEAAPKIEPPPASESSPHDPSAPAGASADLARVSAHPPLQRALLAAGRDPTERAALLALRDAARAAGEAALERAADHVLAAFTPTAPAQPPPPAPRRHDPQLALKLALRELRGPWPQALTWVWQEAHHIFRRELAPLADDEGGVAEAEPDFVRGYRSLAASLGVDAPPLIRRPSAGPLTASIALHFPPAIVVAGEARPGAPEDAFRLGAALVSTRPPLTLFAALSPARLHALADAVSAAFGPTRGERPISPVVASLAGALWQAIDSPTRQRLLALKLEAAGPSLADALARARGAARRAGLIACGDVGVALREVIRDEGMASPVAVDSLEALGVLARRHPSLLDLLRLALDADYAALRWGAPAEGPARAAASSAGK
jgi:tetratricopeptide (TPR) repeat protein